MVIIYDDERAGIAFEMNDHQKCLGITVHKPGEPAYETYHAFLGDVKCF